MYSLSYCYNPCTELDAYLSAQMAIIAFKYAVHFLALS